MLGQTLSNRYRIESVLGEGATSIVYRALDMRTEHAVAIKVLSDEATTTARQEFEQSARAAIGLNHPGLMTIYDVDQDGEIVYLVAELVEGRPLHALIPAAPMVVAAIGRKICLALDYAHRAGFVHRDLKPDNIYVLPQQRIKILDLGLAISAVDQSMQASGSIIGTPAYLSPEQAQGKPVDPRSDLYSVGVILYELLTGQLPFTADDVGTLLLQHVRDLPKAPHYLMADTPRFLERAILRALDKQPEARFATAAAMADALNEPYGVDMPTPVPALPSTANPPIRVAIVDDYATLRTTLIMALRYHPNIQVVAQGDDGQDAIDLCRRTHPDVLLLDLNMPRKNGLVALTEIKRDFPATKIVILSGREESAYILQSLRSGASGYVIKSANEDALIRAIEDVYAGKIVLGEGVAERILDSYRLAEADDPLYEDEKAVLNQVVMGFETNAAIAMNLGWDEVRVTRSLMHAIDKLHAPDRIEAGLIALRAGWITLGSPDLPFTPTPHDE